MLHEILLSLSGHRSPIWETVRNHEVQEDGLHTYVSTPECPMLEVLGNISELHLKVKEAATSIAASHRSVVCRATGSAISEQHLGTFRKKVLQVEASVLQRDAGYVGGYNIVPLSTVVGEFAPWTKRLEWLLKVTDFASGNNGPSCTAKDMLDFLQLETHTGYSDIAQMATELLCTAQKVWIRLLASWTLYGKLPAVGADDLFIQMNKESKSALDRYKLRTSLIPKILTIEAAESTLAIGTALNHIQDHNQSRTSSAARQGLDDSVMLGSNLRLLDALTFPLNSSSLLSTIIEIDLSISQNALCQLLPTEQIQRVLNVIHRYMLLDEGEFATALIEHAAERVLNRGQKDSMPKPVRKIGRLDDISMKDAELNGIFNKVWDELAGLQAGQSFNEEVFELARDILSLQSIKDEDVPICTILPTGATLHLDLPLDSNLRLFLTPSDITMYSAINAYLLSIRRTELHLSGLWKLTSHRRCHPTPLGPPVSATGAGRQALATTRSRETSRQAKMRQHWASASRVLFVLNEFDAYLHGEAIDNSWSQLQNWLTTGSDSSRPGTSRSQGSRPGTASSAKSNLKTSQLSSDNSALQRKTNDPRSLANAHHTFLKALYAGLLLDNQDFVSTLKELLSIVDHYVALFGRLQSVWQGLDLQEDDGVVDAFSNYAEDEQAILGELTRSRDIVENGLKSFVDTLKGAEKTRLLDDTTVDLTQLDLERRGFVPWKLRTMDRLIMKLDFLSTDRGAGNAEDVLDLDDE